MSLPRLMQCLFMLALALTHGAGHAQTPRAPVGAALVIANSDHRLDELDLVNPRVDGRLVSAALRSAGFHVFIVEDASRARMLRAATDFRAFMAGTRVDVALLYYSGHGFQAASENYIVGTDTDTTQIEGLTQTSLSLSALFAAAFPQSANDVSKIVVLDACRNALPVPERNTGFLRFDPPENTALLLSTLFGTVAHDGVEGAGSYFANAFADFVAVPGLSFQDSYQLIKDEVFKQYSGLQRPVLYSDLDGAVSLNLHLPSANETLLVRAAHAGIGDRQADFSRLIKRVDPAGDRFAMLLLAFYYADQGEKGWRKALDLLRELALHGRFVDRERYLAAVQQAGHVEDIARATQDTRRWMEDGDPFSALFLADRTLRGNPTVEDRDRAVGFIKRAAEKGVVGAQVSLSGLYGDGLYGLAKDKAEAQYWTGMAAAQGDEMSMLVYTFTEDEGADATRLEKVKYFLTSASRYGSFGGQMILVLMQRFYFDDPDRIDRALDWLSRLEATLHDVSASETAYRPLAESLIARMPAYRAFIREPASTLPGTPQQAAFGTDLQTLWKQIVVDSFIRQGVTAEDLPVSLRAYARQPREMLHPRR